MFRDEYRNNSGAFDEEEREFRAERYLESGGAGCLGLTITFVIALLMAVLPVVVR